MSNETNIPNDVDLAAVEAGLEELKRRPNKLSTLIGDPKKTYRAQLRFTAVERATLKTINVALAMLVGRGVSHALALRLSISLLRDQCTAALRDPAAAARLKAMLLEVREARAKEYSGP